MDPTTNTPTSPTLNLMVIPIRKPDEINLILGQAHFIKTVEDLHEALVTAVPGIRFGLAFCESSGPALVRWSGTDEELTALASATMRELGAGHAFLILLRDAFPINVLPAVRAVAEVCGIYCASANSVQVIIAETEQGRGIQAWSTVCASRRSRPKRTLPRARRSCAASDTRPP